MDTVSRHANEKLKRIKECQLYDPASWPQDIPLCCWQGGIDSTWSTYVGENLLTTPISLADDIAAVDSQLAAPGFSFVYLWCFLIHGRQYYKVGYTVSMRRRNKEFLNTIPPPVMTHAGVYHLAVLPTEEVDERETAFTIAARQFYLGNEWFSFDAVGDEPLAILSPRPVEFFA